MGYAEGRDAQEARNHERAAAVLRGLPGKRREPPSPPATGDRENHAQARARFWP